MKAQRNIKTGKITIKVKPGSVGASVKPAFEKENRPVKVGPSKDYPITASAKIVDKGPSAKVATKSFRKKSDSEFESDDRDE